MQYSSTRESCNRTWLYCKHEYRETTLPKTRDSLTYLALLYYRIILASNTILFNEKKKKKMKYENFK